MFKQKTLRYIFALSVLLTIISPSINAYFIYPTFTRLLISFTESEAARLADHFKKIVIEGETLKAPEQFIDDVLDLQEKFHLTKLKVFSHTGETIYSTDRKDIGVINTKPYFINKVASGEIYTKFVQKDTKSLENQIVTADVVETYIPIMSRGYFLGAFEIYYDITAHKKKLDELVFYSSMVPLAIMFTFLLLISVSLFKLDRSVTRRRQAEKALQRAHDQLERQVEERTSELTQANKQLLQEIATKKGIEQELRRAAEEWQCTFDSMSDGISIHDSNNKIIKANSALQKLLNIPLMELQNQNCYQLFHHTDKPINNCPADKCLHKKRPSQIEKFEPWLDLWLSISCSPIFNENNGVRGIVHVVRDVTKRRIAEEELRRTRNYLDNLINSMPSVLIGVNQEGGITRWNNEAEKVFGLSSEEVAGRMIEDVLPYDAEQMEKLRKAIDDKAPDRVERLVQHIDGETLFFDMIVYPLQESSAGAVIRIDDVTARVKLENMMVQTEKMMSVGGLAAGMAHEINNPLGGIIQSIQNTFRRFSPDMKKNIEVAAKYGVDLDAVNRYMKERSILTFLEGINDSALRAAKIVRGMLTFSRQSEPTMYPVDLGELIERTVDLAAQDYDLKKSYDFRYIKIDCDFSPDLPEVPCIETELEQVILNLLRNAAQAMREENEDAMTESPLITLETRKTDGYALIIVKDNGPGMDSKTAKRVFEPFFTTKKPGVGTGLGLSVSYFIITENHGGSMTVESRQDSGAKFTISLPLQRS